MLYSSTHVATMGVKGLSFYEKKHPVVGYIR